MKCKSCWMAILIACLYSMRNSFLKMILQVNPIMDNRDDYYCGSSPNITTVSNTLYNRTSWITQHTLSSDHIPIITTFNIRHDYRQQHNLTKIYKLQESRVDTIYLRHRICFHSAHNTHQHTDCQYNFHKHHSDGRQTQYTKG